MRKKIAAILKWLLNLVDPQCTALYFLFHDGTTTHKVKHMKSILKDNGVLQLAVLCLSAAGNKVIPEIEVSDPSLATAAMSADGTLLTVTPTGKAGDFTVTARAGNLVATDDVSVIPGDAVTLTLTQLPDVDDATPDVLAVIATA